MRRKSTLKEGPLSRGFRIYTARLLSEHWRCKIVSVGEGKLVTQDSLTPKVIGIPGEYESEETAVQAAKRYIDQKAGHGQE